MTVSTRMSGLALAVAAPVLWSFGGLIVRGVEAAPWDIVLWRAIGHVATLLPLLLIIHRAGLGREIARGGLAGVAVGVLFGAVNVFHVLAISHTSVANTLVLQGLSPFIASLVAALVLHERLDRPRVIAMVIALAGFVLVIGGSIGRGQVVGDVFALLVALCGSTAIVISRHARSFDLIPATLISGAVAIAVALPFADPLAPSAHDMAWMAILGLMQVTMGLSLFLMALRRLPVVEVTLIALLEPVLGPVWVWIFVAEVPPATTLIGGAIVITALVVNTLWSTRRARVVP